MEPVATFASLIDAEAARRGSARARQLIVLGDGATWIWNLAAEHFPAATHIVDLYHARQHLHDLVAIVAPSLGQDTPDWLAERLGELDRGDIAAWRPRRATCPYPTPKPPRSKRPETISRPTPPECATPSFANKD
jgi:hypothetical protein